VQIARGEDDSARISSDGESSAPAFDRTVLCDGSFGRATHETSVDRRGDDYLRNCLNFGVTFRSVQLPFTVLTDVWPRTDVSPAQKKQERKIGSAPSRGHLGVGVYFH